MDIANAFDPIFTAIVAKLAVAAILGTLIGLERKSSHKEAGLRTFSLIAMGCALFVAIGNDIIPALWKAQTINPMPVVASLVTGLGFLGAGLIIFHDNKIRGLTTAASVWMTAAIGATIGLGMYVIAIAATTIVLFVLIAGWQIEKRLLGLTEDDK